MTSFISKIKKNFFWYFWYPHQGLWNKNIRGKIRETFPKPIANIAFDIVIILDTLILWIIVLKFRISNLGLITTIKLFFQNVIFNLKPKIPAEIPILYFDLGTHKKGPELQWMLKEILPSIANKYQAFGFEASQQFFNELQTEFIGMENVTLLHKALCLSVPPNNKLRLYLAPIGEGVANSIYRSNFAEYEEVDAIKFSDWLRQQNFDLEKSICLLRMNIEGAEFDVISDLIESGMIKYIDGYFGTWDDVGKIDVQKDEQFRALLKEHNIEKITFSEGDLTYVLSPFRSNCIKYQINTCIKIGLRKILNK